MTHYQDTTTQPKTVEPQRYSDRQFLHTINAGVTLPLAQAFTTSVMTMILTAVIVYALDGWEYLKPMAIVGALTFVATWIALAGRWITLTNLERITRMDLNKDGVVGPQKVEPRSLRVQIDRIEENGHVAQSQLFDFTDFADIHQLRRFAEGYADPTMGLTENEWSGPGNPFAIDAYRAFREECVKRGLVLKVVKGKKTIGYFKTPAGKAVFKRIQKDALLNS